MQLIAHRGLWNKNIKDNSYEALKNGLLSNKYIGIECDIRTTLDKKIIIYHNTLYKGNLVRNTNYKDLHDVILLEDLLKIKTDKILLLEIKERDIDKNKLIKLLNKYKRNYYIMSFNNSVIFELRELKKEYKYGVLNYILNSKYDYDLDFICLLDGISSDYIINNFKKRGIEVIIYGTIKIKKDVKYIVDDYKLWKYVIKNNNFSV